MTFAEAVAAFKAHLTPESEWYGEILDRALSGDHSGLYVVDPGEWHNDLAIMAYTLYGKRVAIIYPSSAWRVDDIGLHQVQIRSYESGYSILLDLHDLVFNRARPPKPKGSGRMTREGALIAVLAELDRAQTKFPTWPTDPLHAASILAEEMGELQRAILHRVYEPDKAQPGDVQTEAVQTAAMALRFLLSLDRYVYARSEQHTQEKA